MDARWLLKQRCVLTGKNYNIICYMFSYMIFFFEQLMVDGVNGDRLVHAIKNVDME